MRSLSEELKMVFEENVSASWVPWRTAFYNFHDYIDEISKDKKITDKQLVYQ